MKTFKIAASFIAFIVLGVFSGCSATAAKSLDVSSSIRTSLNQAGLKDISVSQDRDKGIVTLEGQVASENDKAQAESLAKSLAGPQVVANQIAVLPFGVEQQARAVNSDLDEGIEHNLDAALIQSNLYREVKYSVKSGVITLTGNVNSQSRRGHAEQVAAGVANAQQVVNDLQVKNQKASSSQ